MKTKLKKVGKYLLIGFLLLFGLAAIGLLYLFFVPNSSLFGICYVGKDETISSTPYSTSDVSTVALESDNFNVVITESLSDKISVKAAVNLFGFAKTENKECTISASLKNGTLSFVVSEIHGAIINSGSLIELRIPSGFKPNLTIKNNKADLTMDTGLSFKTFNYTSTSGTARLTHGGISGTMNLDLGKTSLYIENSFTLNSNNINLKASTGKIYAEESNFGAINITESNRCTIKANRCNSVTMDVESAGGKIELNNVKTLNISSSDTNIEVKDTWSNGGSITLTKSGKVNINKITSECSITTSDGNISIDTVKPATRESVTLECLDNGNIEIKKAYTWIDVKTKYGDISVIFATDCKKVDVDSAISTSLANSLNNVYRCLFATTHNGKISTNGAEHIELRITNKGSANIYMDNMVGANKIEGSNGNIYIEFNSNTKSAFKLSTKTNTSSSINYLNCPEYQSGITDKQTNNLSIYYKLTNMPATSNSLNIVTTDGNIKVRDTATKDR